MVLYCNTCAARTGHTELWTTAQGGQTGSSIFVRVYRCVDCGSEIFAITHGGAVWERYPYELSRRKLEGLPSDIEADFSEAQTDNGAGSYKSAVMMCRRVIQNAAEDKGSTPGRRLVDQLEELKNNGVLYSPLYKMATQIRVMGGKGAHPQDGKAKTEKTPEEDTLDVVQPEESKQMIDFTAEILNFLYSIDHSISKLENGSKTDEE